MSCCTGLQSKCKRSRFPSLHSPSNALTSEPSIDMRWLSASDTVPRLSLFTVFWAVKSMEIGRIIKYGILSIHICIHICLFCTFVNAFRYWAWTRAVIEHTYFPCAPGRLASWLTSAAWGNHWSLTGSAQLVKNQRASLLPVLGIGWMSEPAVWIGGSFHNRLSRLLTILTLYSLRLLQPESSATRASMNSPKP